MLVGVPLLLTAPNKSTLTVMILIMMIVYYTPVQASQHHNELDVTLCFWIVNNSPRKSVLIDVIGLFYFFLGKPKYSTRLLYY